MSKRPNMRDQLARMSQAAGTAGQGSAPPPPLAPTPTAPKYGDVPMSNTGLHIPTELLLRLQIVAAKRKARRNRGRASVSEIVVELVERHIAELEKDAES